MVHLAGINFLAIWLLQIYSRLRPAGHKHFYGKVFGCEPLRSLPDVPASSGSPPHPDVPVPKSSCGRSFSTAGILTATLCDSTPVLFRDLPLDLHVPLEVWLKLYNNPLIKLRKVAFATFISSRILKSGSTISGPEVRP